MEPTAVEMQSQGIAVERLGRTRAWAWFLVAFAVPTLVFTARPMFSAYGYGPAGGWSVTFFWISLLVFLGSAGRLLSLRFDPTAAARSSLRSPGSVTVHPDEVALAWPGGNQRYPLEELVEGWLERAAGNTTAVLRMRSGDLVSIEVESVAAGQRLLAGAGVAAHQQRWTARLANGASAVTGGGCLAAMASVVLSVVLVLAVLVLGSTLSMLDASLTQLLTPAAWCAADLVGFFLLLRALTPPLLVVGSDGVAVRGFGRRRRFVPFTRVADVVRERCTVTLVLQGGELVRLPTGNPGSALGNAVHRRIAEAMESRGDPGAPGAADVLERAGRSPSEWREHLRRLGQAPEGYRIRTVPPERLATVLEDVASPPERRVAAALALARVEDPTVRRRVQAAVSSCADDGLRHALEAAAADEIAAEELSAVARRRG